MFIPHCIYKAQLQGNSCSVNPQLVNLYLKINKKKLLQKMTEIVKLELPPDLIKCWII